MTGINTVHVPYRGGASMITDVISGQVPAAFDVVANSLPHIRSGSIRALGVTTATPLDTLSGVPVMSDTVPGYEVVAWTGVGVPAGTPSPIVDRLNREINASLAEPDVKARLAELTVLPTPNYSPDQFGAHWRTETGKWGKVIRAAGIKAQ